MARRGGIAVALLLAFSCSDPLSGAEDDNQFRVDVMACEDAFARLESCCPHQPDRLACDYGLYRGCSNELIESVPDDGQHILALSCQAIVEGGYCRAETRPRRRER